MGGGLLSYYPYLLNVNRYLYWGLVELVRKDHREFFEDNEKSTVKESISKVRNFSRNKF